MASDEELIERLDLMVATLKLAYAKEIARERERIRTDPVSAAILDATAEVDVKSSDLQKSLIESAGAKQRTIQRRLQELTALGALRQTGSGFNTSYRSTGLI